MNGKSKFSFSKIFYNDKFVMLFSVIVAFCIWVALPGNSEETVYSYIKDIPISIPDIGNDLKVFYTDKDTASVRVSGNSLILRNLTKDDIEITPDDSLNEIQSADEKTVKLVAKKGSIINDYSIISGSIDPEEITVFVDREEETRVKIFSDEKTGEDLNEDDIIYGIDEENPSEAGAYYDDPEDDDDFDEEETHTS